MPTRSILTSTNYVENCSDNTETTDEEANDNPDISKYCRGANSPHTYKHYTKTNHVDDIPRIVEDDILTRLLCQTYNV